MWHLSQFSKRAELLIKPSNFGYNTYNQPIYVKIPNQIIPYLTESYYISFVDIEGNSLCFFPKKFSRDINEVEYYVNVESIDDVNYTRLFVYYDMSDRSNLDIRGANTGLEVYEYRRNTGLPHPNNHLELLDCYRLDYSIYDSYTSTAIGLSASRDNYCYFVTGWFYVADTVSGTWGFALDSDDAAEVEVDGSVIVGWYGGHGVCNCYDHNADIYLEGGWHKFVARHEEISGGDALRVYVKPCGESTWFHMGTATTPCMSFSYIGSSIYTSDFIVNSEYDMFYTQPSNVFEGAYIVNFLDTTSLASKVGPNFSNHNAALHQPICDTYAAKILGGTTYIMCSISKSTFTLFFNCYLLSGDGYLVYFSHYNYIYVNADGSLTARVDNRVYNVSSKLYFDTCSTLSITCDGNNTYIVINGSTKLTVNRVFNITEIRLGGDGTSGYSLECYFWELLLLPYKLPLYSYYLHNTVYDNSNFFREAGYDDIIVNGYLTSYPEVIFSGDQAIFKANSCSGVVYSASFDAGSNWYVSDLEYDDIFYKDFNVAAELETILRLKSGAQIIDKNYIININNFNSFNINYAVDFFAAEKKDGETDTITQFTTSNPDYTNIVGRVVEYDYGGKLEDLITYTLGRPTEFTYDNDVTEVVISKPVEYCYDGDKDSWFDDIDINFGLGQLCSNYYIDTLINFILCSGIDTHEDINVNFVLANWKYFPNQTSIICSTQEQQNKEMYAGVGDGRLMRFLTDIKASAMQYDNFNSSIFCSLSGIIPNYLSNVQVTGGLLSNYNSDVFCSLLDSYAYSAEVKLNTIVIENFNIGVADVIVGVSNFCFSVDVYDSYYGVTTSGISICMNTNIISGNLVSSPVFTLISGGYTASWCYDVGNLSPAEYIEVAVAGVNTYGDSNAASYFLRYGQRYHYNLYHIKKHEYESLIPMLMVAENNVDIFPSFSTESMYVHVENYKRTNLSASIFGVGLDRKELPAGLDAVTTNFYNGGVYKVKVECSDLSGNAMNPFEFEFSIRSDGL